MSERPVLPDLSPAQALRELLLVGVQSVAILAGLLALLALAAFLVGRLLTAGA